MNTKGAVLTVFFLLSISYSYCQKIKNKSINNSIISKLKHLSNHELKNWHHKDYENDTIPGISLDKLYKSKLLDGRKANEIIVAVIDTKLDIDHFDLKGQIWENKDEIADNGIDDDKNGFIDDKNGWNFLGNSNGEYLKYQSSETVRIIRKYQKKFELKDSATINKHELPKYTLFLRAKTAHKNSIKELKSSIRYFEEWITKYPLAIKAIQSITEKEDFSIRDLDNILNSSKDSIINSYANLLKSAKQKDRTVELYKHYIEWYKNMLATTFNLNYNERDLIGDDSNDIKDSIYGNNIVSGKVPFNHSIVVSGVIGANRTNNLGAIGFSKNIKIMPIVMVASGAEHDKDIALAIRYAVNNGAKIINMSWGKKFSLNQKWILEAMKYAESKNVFIVHAAGNDGVNTDNNTYFPNDYLEDIEFVDNFIVVGASTYKLDKNLIAGFSNYGKKTVDVFAPGVKIYTTKENNSFVFSRGTSLAAPMVSGLAGLLWSFFPKLSTSELKKIIMESGTSFDIPVTVTSENNTKKEIYFTQLSKSGKIINAYNAFLMASEIYKTTYNKK
jgi:subtilisin family serine protease